MANQYIPPPIDLGLFWWNSDRSEAEKIAITNWYRSLDPIARSYVNAIREEERDDALYSDWNYD